MLGGKNIDLGVQPDVLIIEPLADNDKEKKETAITVDQIRQVRRQSSLSSCGEGYKIALIDQAEKMTAEAANCLLKTLEEPAGRSVLILITSAPNLLLTTIVSRCQVIKFLPVANKEMKKIPGTTEEIVRLAAGRPGMAFRYVENPELIREREQTVSQLEKIINSDLNSRYQLAEGMAKDAAATRRMLDYWLIRFRDLILIKIGCPELSFGPTDGGDYGYSLEKLKTIVQAIKETKRILTNPSFNGRLALEALMLEI